MSHTTTAGRGLAIAAGVVLASGTLGILFEDVLMYGAPITLKHWLTLVTVSGTMMVGHLADLARRQRHWMSVMGFTALFLAGTGLVVYSSVGRQAEKTLISGAEHDELVQKRLDLKSKLVAEGAALKAKQDAADMECKSGDGPRCKGAKAIVSVYADSVAGIEARIEKIATPKPVDAEAEQFAAVAAAIGYDKDQVRALAIMLAPFGKTLFLEFGTIVCLGFAASPRHKLRQLPTPSETQQSSYPWPENLMETVETFRSPPPIPETWGNPGNRGGGSKVYSRVEAERDLVTRLALGETIPSQDCLAQRWFGDGWKSHKGTVSKWLADWEDRKMIPARKQIGRCKQLTQT